jgi:hypothetical protein
MFRFLCVDVSCVDAGEATEHAVFIWSHILSIVHKHAELHGPFPI